MFSDLYVVVGFHEENTVWVVVVVEWVNDVVSDRVDAKCAVDENAESGGDLVEL